MKIVNDLRRLFSFLARHARGTKYARLSLLILSIAGVLSGLSTTGLLGLINELIQRSGEPSPWMTWAFIGLCIGLPLLRFASSALLTYLTQQSVYHLRTQLSRKILRAPLGHLERLGSHRLLAALTDDIPTVSGALLTLPNICMNAAIVFGSLGYLLWLSPTVFGLVVGFLLIGAVSYHLPMRKAIQTFTARREAWDAAFESLQIVTEGTKELKQHRPRRTFFVRGRLDSDMQTVRQHAIVGALIYAGTNVWGQMLFFALIGLLLFYVPGWTGAGGEVLTGFTLILLYMMSPLEMLLNTLPGFSRAAVSVQKITDLGLTLDDAKTDLLPPEEGKTPSDWSSIALRDVVHSYESPKEEEVEGFTVGPLNLTLEPGTIVFLTGGNGSGKTTLAKLLLGLYVPDKGTLCLDGELITDENRDNYRQLFSAIFSDSFIFESLMGLTADDLDAQAQRYLRELRIDHKVHVEDGELSTTDLSRGQRKRLALLTAYLEDRPLYVFDEWAAEQDPTFKEVFYHEILPSLTANGKTVIAISHDDRYFHVADIIVEMEEGQIITPTSELDATSDLPPESERASEDQDARIATPN